MSLGPMSTSALCALGTVSSYELTHTHTLLCCSHVMVGFHPTVLSGATTAFRAVVQSWVQQFGPSQGMIRSPNVAVLFRVLRQRAVSLPDQLTVYGDQS